MCRDLADDSNEVGVFIFDIKEYTTTLDLSTPPPDAPQRRQIIELPKYVNYSFVCCLITITYTVMLFTYMFSLVPSQVKYHNVCCQSHSTGSATFGRIYQVYTHNYTSQFQIYLRLSPPLAANWLALLKQVWAYTRGYHSTAWLFTLYPPPLRQTPYQERPSSSSCTLLSELWVLSSSSLSWQLSLSAATWDAASEFVSKLLYNF